MYKIGLRTAFTRLLPATSRAQSIAISKPFRVRTFASSSKLRGGMFCMQCEQTEHQTGCTTLGICGKTPEVSRLQDLLMAFLKGISMYATRARALGKANREMDRWIIACLFATMTNVNFDDTRFVKYLNEAQAYLDQARVMYLEACKEKNVKPQALTGFNELRLSSTTDAEVLTQQAMAFDIPLRQQRLGADYVGVQELIIYGLKGTAAYAHHALEMGREHEDVYAAATEALDFVTREDATMDELLAGALAVGKINYKVMELLDDGHTGTFGHPEPTKVRMTGVQGKAILVSGHDIPDLVEILKQSEGKGINVYTHGELLPAHAYPEVKKYKHLKGHYGGPWQLQKMDFFNFPGPIVMTTNCLIEPLKGYKKRIFTRSVVGWKNVTHLEGKNFAPVIESALEEEGFEEDEPEKYELIGFARNAVLSVADKVIEGVKSGAIKHFFVIGGCDGSEGERNYYTKVAQLAPQDTVMLTLGCGKYRINGKDYGTIGGIPRLLDLGQCNDAYSAIQIALALSKAFNVGVNDLPLSLVISWFEQKAVAVFLTMLHLNMQNIYLGPNLPAFVTPNVLKVLQEKFQLHKVGTEATAKAQVAHMLGKKEEEL